MTSGDGLIEVRGVVAMNGQGEVCFFAHSRAEGLPLLAADGFGANHFYELPAALKQAPARRVTHEAFRALDPEVW